MKVRPLLAISVAANLVMGVVAAKLVCPLLQPVPPATAKCGASSESSLLRIVTNLPPQVTFVTNAFHWRQLVSTNYDEFVANLRAVGCPERTIRDIIVSDVWVCWARAKNDEDGVIPFWQNGPRRAAAEHAREAALMQFKDDLASTLKRLFGIEWSPELKRDAFGEEQLLCRVLLGDITEEQFERAVGLLGRVEEIKEEVRWRAHDVLLEEDYAELARRRDEIERELSMILSHAQFEEFRARASVAEQLIGHLFGGGDGLEELKPSPEELRQIALARAAIWPLGWEALDLGDNETAEEKEARERLMDTRLRTILGEDRYAEALLLRDGDYRNIHRFAQVNQVSTDTAHKLYDIQKLAREEVRGLRDDKSLGAAARSERIEAVTVAIAPQVGELLGPKLFGEYLHQSGQWVTNANRL